MRRLLLAAVFIPAIAQAQFILQQSNTAASLRGIANVDGKVAWASGTAGTVLKTLDGGAHWQACAVPANADKLDFRAVSALDGETALVLSIGKGDQSRVYRTTDGCKTWQPAFTNPEPDGFFDALYFPRRGEASTREGWILGDPVNGRFYLAFTHDGGLSWHTVPSPTLATVGSGGAFAASNQSLTVTEAGPIFGGGGGLLYRGEAERCPDSTQYNDPEACRLLLRFRKSVIPVGSDPAASSVSSPSTAAKPAPTGNSAGIFALFAAGNAMVAVGGDYQQPSSPTGIAAYSLNGGASWEAAATQPRGYRSTVAYDAAAKTWIATGPTGTDISTDNGNHWQPLLPDAAKGDTPDADKNWNALALPFVVGPKGRIGKLRTDALGAKP